MNLETSDLPHAPDQTSRQFFDSHAHLDDPQWPAEETVASVAGRDGWLGTLSAGYGPERFAASRAACASEPRVARALGLHPWWLADRDEAERERGWTALQAELAVGDAVAIGELGLDKSLKERFSAADQERWMRRELALAVHHDLPLVLHIVGWYGKALDILRQAGQPWRGVVHRWSGPAALVPDYVALGLHISLALEPRENPDKRAAVARAVPAGRLLVESDWPFAQLDYGAALDATWDLAERVAYWRGEPVQALVAAHNASCRDLFFHRRR